MQAIQANHYSYGVLVTGCAIAQ